MTRLLLAIFVAASLAITPVHAQAIRTDKKQFYLPIRIAEGGQAVVSSMKLFMSSDQGRTWTFCEEIGVSKTKFTVQVPKWGEYWFTVQTIHKTGRKSPEDVAKAIPSLKVLVVDKLPPDTVEKKAAR